ncbi:MAG: aminoglycoside phosphotransferase family protein [Opitutaceae bacterium]
MPSLLPRPTVYGDYQRFKLDPATDWPSIAREIARQHGLTFALATRFNSGENPVLNLDGRYVIKLVPLKFWPLVIRREMDALTFLHGQDFPAAELIGHGEIDGWAYLVCTQLPGESFRTVWSRLAIAEKRPAARAFGALLGALHRLPIGETKPGGVLWENFLREGAANWLTRGSVQALPALLRDRGLAYIRDARLQDDDGPIVFLHGDLVPENCLVTSHDGAWKFSGVYDFGNAFAGRATFDLTAATVLIAPLDAETLREFLAGYGRDAVWLEQQRRRLMAYTLLHPLGNAAALLELIPGGKHATSWDEIAAKYWPA